MIAGTKRLKILSRTEIKALYDLPVFSDEERQEYFSLSILEKGRLGEFHSIKSKNYFILQLGYFKAKNQFFVFGLDDVKEDLNHICDRYFFAANFDNQNISKTTRLKQQRKTSEQPIF